MARKELSSRKHKEVTMSRFLVAKPGISVLLAVFLALALAACSGSSSDKEDMEMPPPVVEMPEPEPEPEPEPTELEMAQTAAEAAAGAAMTASTDAGTAASAAATAAENLALVQTNAAAAGNAKNAADAAAMAKTASDAANAASGTAADVDTVTAAVTAKLEAEAAQGDAEMYGVMAAEESGKAVAAAATELKIVEKTKSVGDTSITVGASKSEVTTTTGGKSTTVITGGIGKISAMSEAVDLIMDAVVNESATPPVLVAVVAKPAIVAQSINIGLILDSDDDSARLRLVTHYIGTATVGAYNDNDRNDNLANTLNIMATAHDAYDHTPGDADTVPAVRIRTAPGMFYEADMSVDGDVADDATVMAGAKSTELFYYDVVTPGDPSTTERTWLRRMSSTTDTAGVVTHNYAVVTAVVGVKGFPMATAFKHVHYGTWNGLSGSGDNKLADLGIAFANPTADGSMTGSDMPNVGSAEYNGHWVASVRAADPEGDGTISSQSGNSKVMANFEKNEINVDLDGLAVLDGAIAGDRFHGTKVSGVKVGNGSLDADGTFMGGFNGAFFGPKAAEAGGVFDYTSKDQKAGEFRGAFGGDKK